MDNLQTFPSIILSEDERRTMILDTEFAYKFDISLHMAAFAENYDLLCSLLTNSLMKINLDKKARPIGYTPLHLAANVGCAKCLLCLLEHGADLETLDFKGQTPLFVAAHLQRTECLRLLLEAGANPNGSAENCSRPLVITIRHGYMDGLQLLLRFGAELDVLFSVEGGFSRTCPNGLNSALSLFSGAELKMAACYKRLDCFAALLLGGATVNWEKATPSLPENVIRYVSPLLAIISYSCPVEFQMLLLHFGDHFSDVRLTKQSVVLSLTHPPSLQQLSRLLIRKTLTRWRLWAIGELGLPAKLVDYLNYTSELDELGLRSLSGSELVPDRATCLRPSTL